MDFYLLLKIQVKKINRNLSRKFSVVKRAYKSATKVCEKLIDSVKRTGATKVAEDVIKTASKRAIQKRAEATGDLINT